jgi:hypothetical protein
MSATDQTEPEAPEAPAPVAAVAAGSLQDRIAAQEAELQQAPEHAIILPIPWLAGFSVQYRALSMRECFKLESRSDKVKDAYDKNLNAVCDKLINACEAILEDRGVIDGQETYEQTPYKWGATAARDLFRRSLPDAATARQGLLAIFPDEEILFDHFAAYEVERKRVRTGLDQSLEGNSEASSAAI